MSRSAVYAGGVAPGVTRSGPLGFRHVRTEEDPVAAPKKTDVDVAPPVEDEAPAVEGLVLVRSEFNGEAGPEHHWFTIPSGHDQAQYQAELDAFIASRYGLTSNDVTVTSA